jgi:hypothetical protein
MDKKPLSKEFIQVLKSLARRGNCWCFYPPILGCHEDICLKIRKIVRESK